MHRQGWELQLTEYGCDLLRHRPGTLDCWRIGVGGDGLEGSAQGGVGGAERRADMALASARRGIAVDRPADMDERLACVSHLYTVVVTPNSGGKDLAA